MFKKLLYLIILVGISYGIYELTLKDKAKNDYEKASIIAGIYLVIGLIILAYNILFYDKYKIN